ncbi:MAG: MFS transporter [Phycisphaerales bacterium]|jgi:MFS family permease|nr:MFS transporter [Phycisphaerales bacterium]
MKNLQLLWIGQFVSQVGDAFFMVTLPFLILLIGGENASSNTGIVTFMYFLPFLIIGPFAGALVDRVRKKRLMLTADILRAGLIVTLPLAAMGGCLSWPLVGGVAFCLATVSSAFVPARDALLPILADRRSLTRVNAWFQMSNQMAMIVGSLSVALLLGINEDSTKAALASGDMSAEIARIVNLYWVDGATFLVSFMLLLGIVARKDHPGRMRKTSALHDVREGLSYARRSGLLRGILFITAVDNFFIMGPAIIGSNLLIFKTYGLGASYIAIFHAVLCVGWLVGSVIIAKWGTRWPKGKLIIIGMIMDGLTFIPFFWIRSFPLLLCAHAFHGLWIPFIQVCRTTLVQEKTPEEMHGRIFSLINLTFVGCTSLSVLATGLLGNALSETGGPPTIYLIAGIGGGVCGMVGLAFTQLRRSR